MITINNTYSFWRATGAAVQGRKHSEKNIPCQDSVCFLSKDPLHVISLADGAGSCSLSHLGAERVTHCLADLLRRNIKSMLEMTHDELRSFIARHLLDALSSLAKRLRVDLKSLSSTFLFTAVYEDNYISGHIGDGVIGCLKNGNLHLISEPESGEFINFTVFVTSPDMEKHLRIRKGSLDGIEGFFLMSDGAAESLYDRKRKTFGKALLTMLEWLVGNTRATVQEALSENLTSIIRSRTTDDCSICLLKRSTIDARKFAALPPDLISDMLISGGHTLVFVRNHARILGAMLPDDDSVSALGRKTGLSRRTVQRHLKFARTKGL